jgi:catechol 2,3-dioxygenase-like lactoylglutathione lyase family enzyme
MKYICSLICVDDIAQSRYFYEEVLGQTVLHDFGENVSFKGGFAIHQKNHFEKLTGKMAQMQANNTELYFEENHLDKLVPLLKKENVEFVHEIREQDWKQRVIRFYDPDKHLIEVGESMDFLVCRLKKEGHTVEEIVNITSLPESFVRQVFDSENIA